MIRCPKLKPVPRDAVVALLILFLAGLPFAADYLNIFDKFNHNAGLCAVVYLDGVEADRVWLRAGEQPEERVYQNNGYDLNILFHPDGEAAVMVSKADCPSQVCVHTGRIFRTGQVILCLPSRIVIRLEGVRIDPDAPDAVLG